MNLRQLPNVITLVRMGLVGPMVGLLAVRDYRIAFLVFVLAAGSDALDGLLAKRFGWTSRFGAIADPLADKLLMLSCYFMLAWNRELSWWLFGLVLARDLVIVGGALVYHYRYEPVEMAPTYLSKCNTLLQILLIVALVFSLGWWPMPTGLILALTVGVVLSTLASGADYVWRWSHLAAQAQRRRRT